MTTERADLVVVGAGAAGLMTAIWAGRTALERGEKRRVVALDGARTLGAKILVAGGGRCNVTHYEVDESAYAGSSRNAIKKVLRAFPVARTVEFFREIGVELKREETGKLFPVTDDAHTVLEALLREAKRVGVEIVHPWRVERVLLDGDGFILEKAPLPGLPAEGEGGADATQAWAQRVSLSPALPQGGRGSCIRASKVIVATGGKSLPRSGSDGHGHEIVKSLGHTVTDRVVPSLVPLVVRGGHFVRELSGVTVPATVEVRSSSGKRVVAFTNSTLCTHFGLSGPSVLDASRYYTHAKMDDPGAQCVINWLPGESFESVDSMLQSLGARTVLSGLRERMPERLARALCAEAGVDAATKGASLSREARRALAHAVTACVIPVEGDRGWTYAEVTAGGVPLEEVDLATMESRVRAGLHLVGEVCDVDGRIGGFNFQWAWASGYVAGVAAGGG